MKTPIRILHAVSKMNRGGIETFVMNIYRAIDRNKVQFDFLDHTEEKGAFDDEILSLGGRIYKLKTLSGSYFLQYGRDLAYFFAAHPEYKIIHSHLNLLSTFTLRGAKAAGIPTRIAHSHTNRLLNRGLKKIVKLYAKMRMNAYPTHKFACSKEAAIWQFGKNEYDQGRITIIPNGINLEKFLFSETIRRQVRSRLGIGDGEILFAHSGGFRAVKNHTFLVRLFYAIKKRIPESRLLLIGDGKLKDGITALTQKLGIFDSVIFTGSVPNVSDYLCAADCFVFPSLYEGLGISLIEAQVSGLTCLTSNTIPDEAVLSDRCFKLDLDNPESWVLKITDEAVRFAERRFPEKAKRFDITQCAKQLEAFYLEHSRQVQE